MSGAKKRKISGKDYREEVLERKKHLAELFDDDPASIKFDALEKVPENFQKILLKDPETENFLLEQDMVLCVHDSCKAQGFQAQVNK